jgi:hypothetical protein
MTIEEMDILHQKIAEGKKAAVVEVIECYRKLGE